VRSDGVGGCDAGRTSRGLISLYKDAMQIFRVASLVLDAVTSSFKPTPGSGSREIRINGAICVALGFAILLAAIPLMMVTPARWSAPVLMLPSLSVYVLFLVGGYRLVLGAHAEKMSSAARIAFGIIFIASMFGALIGGAMILQSLGVVR
jgi:hypothetical protein